MLSCSHYVFELVYQAVKCLAYVSTVVFDDLRCIRLLFDCVHTRPVYNIPQISSKLE